jgi:vancomycin permeability regulator SanA
VVKSLTPKIVNLQFAVRHQRLFKLFFRAALAGTAAFAVGITVLVWDGLHDDVHPADLGVVLGNTVFPDGTPSPRLAARLDRTLELHREGMFHWVLVSGATGKEGRDEALAMRDYLLRNGVPAAQVLVDSDGHTTFATAANASALMKQHGLRSALVISQYFHVPRVRLALQRFGVAKVYSAHARYFELRDIYSVPRELIGFVRYILRSYDVPPPKA